MFQCCYGITAAEAECGGASASSRCATAPRNRRTENLRLRRMKLFLLPTVAATLLGLTLADGLPAAFPAVELKPVSVGELTAPVDIANAGDGSGRLFVCDQKGKIRIIQQGTLVAQPFLDLSAKVIALNAGYDERGLLGLAFHPNFNKRDGNNQPLPGFGRFYVFYSAVSPNATGNPSPVNCRSTISEFRVSADPNLADPSSERIVLSYDKPQSNHNGGQLEFGPDGFLYISVGDGGGANDNNFGHTGGGAGSPVGVLGNAQDRTVLFGKLLRIDPLGSNGPGGQYSVPPTNPFVGLGGGVREEIYAFGLRNPWRASFDVGSGGTNRLFLADVGQNSVEEVDLILPGANYGWRAREAGYPFDATAPNPSGIGFSEPIAQYAHPGVTLNPPLPQLGTSIIGGYLYRGRAFPALVGKYIFGDYNTGSIGSGTTAGTILGIEETSPGTWSTPTPLVVVGGNPVPTHLLALGRDEAGEIYLATQVVQGPQNDPATGRPTGGIYQIVPVTVGRLTNVSARARVETGAGTMIGGFVIEGAAAKRVLIRAIGPTLAAAGVANVLVDPQLALVSNGATIASSDNWQTAANAADIVATGLAPTDARESAILATLNPGAYTAVVSGAAGASGIALVEVYDLDNAGALPRVVNLSARSRIQTADNVEILGFAIRDGSHKVLVRGLGPSFAAAGVSGALANPTLNVISAGTGRSVGSNDGWQTQAGADVAAIQSSGYAPTNPLEAAVILNLPEGNYTAILTGAGGGVGIGSIELYEVN